ncbi:MAG: Crp/Fnr family transcriptional regulator [Magnetovibrio sp.]|nr:Crp/Fnr family transcriptional regulator [Magnetovibrio sp.]
MSPTSPAADWTSQFPSLANLEPDTTARLGQTALTVNLAQGQHVFRAGDTSENFLLVLDGVVRVQMISESGREIVLYRVDAGQTCVLTTACLLGHDPYIAEGITETPVRAIAIPAQVFHDLLGRSTVLRDFVFQSYGARITNLMMLVEEVAFGRLDERLARFLCDNAGADNTLTITHQQLAFELGSAREVISRQLKEFERRDLVKLNRGQITLIDAATLATMGQSK